MYMKSVAGSDGVLSLTVTFRPGTDPDDAQVRVQNRVAQAQARLPEEVRAARRDAQSTRPPSRWSCTCSRPTAATTGSTCATTPS